EAATAGVEGQAGAIVDLGASSDRFGGSALVRATVPQHAGGGRFQQTAFLVGALWRHRSVAWETRAELRGGALLVSGIGFLENDHPWLLWGGAAGVAGPGFAGGALGGRDAG